MHFHLIFLPKGISITDNHILLNLEASSKADIKLAAFNASPGTLPPETTFESYIGHDVINISNFELNENHVKALEKGVNFCPTPKGLKYGMTLRHFAEY